MFEQFLTANPKAYRMISDMWSDNMAKDAVKEKTYRGVVQSASVTGGITDVDWNLVLKVADHIGKARREARDGPSNWVSLTSPAIGYVGHKLQNLGIWPNVFDRLNDGRSLHQRATEQTGNRDKNGHWRGVSDAS